MVKKRIEFSKIILGDNIYVFNTFFTPFFIENKRFFLCEF